MEKPKRPLSAYMIWLNSERESIKKENPGIKVTEIAKKGGELWRAMKDKSVSTPQTNFLHFPSPSSALFIDLPYFYTPSRCNIRIKDKCERWESNFQSAALNSMLI